MKVCQITVHLIPNVGGVETHLSDLIQALSHRGWNVLVLSYSPLTTKAKWRVLEREENTLVVRIPWLAGLFYRLVPYPPLEFLYLAPGLFVLTPFILLTQNPDVVHGHGLVAGAVAVFWGRIFNKRIVVSVHSIYHFPQKGLYRAFVKWIFNNADFVLGLSKQAIEEINSLGIPKDKIKSFTYWIDLNKFKEVTDAKSRLKWDKKFIALFVGRLIPEKGVREVLESARTWNKNIILAVAGAGPLEKEVRRCQRLNSNIKFLGMVNNDRLSLYYSAADLLIVPSTHEEGFGRVILESLACGTPVIASKRGGIPEAMDETVGKFISITPNSIKKTVEYFYRNPDKLNKLSSNCREFVDRKYSEKNVKTIIKAYQR